MDWQWRMASAALVVVGVLGATAASGQPVDPQAVIEQQIRRGSEADRLRHQNEMLRLQIERDELLARRREQSQRQNSPDFSRYGEPVPAPPRRKRPGVACDHFGDGEGGGMSFCD